MQLTNEALCALIRQGRTEYVAALIEQNRGLIHKIANRYAPMVRGQFSGCDYDDLVQAVSMGFFRAATAFDPAACKYSTAAIKRATGEIWRLLGLYSRDGVTGSNRPERHGAVIALDEPLTDADGTEQEETRGDLIADPAAADPAERAAERDYVLSEQVEAALSAIPAAQAALIRLHMIRRFPLRAAAARLGMTVEAAQKEKRRALDRLRRDYKLYALIAGADYDSLAYRHKGVAAFNTTWSSTVEDAVMIAERRRGSR